LKISKISTICDIYRKFRYFDTFGNIMIFSNADLVRRGISQYVYVPVLRHDAVQSDHSDWLTADQLHCDGPAAAETRARTLRSDHK